MVGQWALLGVHWDRPWALWLAPLLILAWWLLLVARRPRVRFTGAFTFWSNGPQQDSDSRRRRLWPVRYWEWIALLFAGLALAGPSPQVEQQGAQLTVLVDRSPSMYLAHGPGAESSRLAVALAQLAEWNLRTSLEFLDPGCDSPKGLEAWPADWNGPTPNPRAEIVWALWDRPNVIWLTDTVPSYEPEHASIIAAGGGFQPGPVALIPGGVLIENAARDLEEESRAAMWVLGGESWPPEWAGFAQLWCEDRGLQWGLGEADDVEVALRLSQPIGDKSGDSSVEFDVDFGPYQIRGLSAAFVPPELLGADFWRLGPWRLSDQDPGSELMLSRPGEVLLRVLEWYGVQGDVGAFVVDFAEVLDRARRFPSDVVSRDERRAALPGSKRQGAVREAENVNEHANSTWAPWLAIGALLCLLGSFGVGLNRSRAR
ncbi:MAG: hypothetical protein ACI87O_001176 [Planctomycetota bacterium]|jgi:hypothetical protein